MSILVDNKRILIPKIEYDIPLVRKSVILDTNTSLIAFSNTVEHEIPKFKSKGVHFFLDDYKFISVVKHPEKYLEKLKQYKFVITPDASLYNEMPIWKQLRMVGYNRNCGAIWQKNGLNVIVSVSWSSYNSFNFCFEGIEKGSTVAIGMIGCKHSKLSFMRGYDKMLEIVEPASIICFGKPFAEMSGNIITIDYNKSKVGKNCRS